MERKNAKQSVYEHTDVISPQKLLHRSYMAPLQPLLTQNVSTHLRVPGFGSCLWKCKSSRPGYNLFRTAPSADGQNCKFFIEGTLDRESETFYNITIQVGETNDLRKSCQALDNDVIQVRGIRRTGTLIGVDRLNQYIRSDKFSFNDHVDIFDIVMSMRRNRDLMVKTEATVQLTQIFQNPPDSVDRMKRRQPSIVRGVFNF